MSGYTIDGDDAFAAIFIRTDGRGWDARHGLDEDDYQAAFEELEGEG